MSRKLLFLISFVAVMCIAGSVSATDLWMRTDDPGVEQDWTEQYTWWNVAVPTSSDDVHIDAAASICRLDTSGVCGELYVGDWYTQWDPNQPTFNIYEGANLLVTDSESSMTGNFELGVQPYEDFEDDDPNFGNHGWGIVNLMGGTVTVEGELKVGVEGVGFFYLKSGKIQAEGFSMGTPTIADDSTGTWTFSSDNLMDIWAGSKLILLGDISSLDSRVIAHMGTGDLVFTYGADVAGYTTITAEIDGAWYDRPFDGETIDTPEVKLMWYPGRNVQSTGGHQLYLGTDFNDVNEADTSDLSGIYIGPLDSNSFVPSVTWAQSYYWRVDEVNDVESWRGPVWSFAVKPAISSNPNPADGSWDAPVDGVLSWTSGGEAFSHEVYLSTDFNEVNDRDVNVLTVEDLNSHDPGGLLMATNYYWVVDEVNELSSTPTWYGDVWTFETVWYRVVDDMDSYASDEDLLATWIDGYSTDKNGSWVRLNGTIVLNGNSMWYEYVNHTKYSQSYGYGSEIEASTTNLACGSDWAVGGVKSLVVPFYGQTGNAIGANDRMYVALKDVNEVEVVVYYDGDANDVTKEEWQEWNIDLTDSAFSVLQMNNITTVYLGFGIHGGDKDAVGGSGEVYFDDIRLYPRRCRAELVAADFNGDCVTDIWDLWEIGNEWLEVGNYTVYPEPAPETNTEGLIVWYKLDETEGTLVPDSSGNGNDGTANAGNFWDEFDSADGNGSLILATDVNVQAPNDMLTLPMDEVTVSLWLKITSDLAMGWSLPFSAGGETDWFMMIAIASQADWSANIELPGHLVVWRTSTRNFETEDHEQIIYDDLENDEPVGWHHYAGTKDVAKGEQSLYVDGVLVAKANWVERLLEPEDANNTEVSLGTSAGDGSWGGVPGKIDDFRIYDHALPYSQILDLAGVAEMFVPMTSPANAYEDNQIDFKDFAIMANSWLDEQQLWP